MTKIDSQINPLNQALGELERLQREAGGETTTVSAGNAGGSFAKALDQAIGSVNQLQFAADAKITAVTTGQSSDTLGAVVALQQADLSLQLLAQVRNKALKAYEEIIRMPV